MRLVYFEGPVGVAAGPEQSQKAEHCCPIMKLALDFSASIAQRRRPVAGFELAFSFAKGTGRYQGQQLVYRIPGHGRGKERVEAKLAIVAACPFCRSSMSPAEGADRLEEVHGAMMAMGLQKLVELTDRGAKSGRQQRAVDQPIAQAKHELARRAAKKARRS